MKIKDSSMSRDCRIDIVKGFAICLVILGHCGCPATHFIYLFHMAAFFMLSGLVYNFNYSSSLSGIKKLLKKRLKSLWIPFFCFSSFFLITWNIGVNLHLYNSDSISFSYIAKGMILSLFMIGPPIPLCGALWFLVSLFFITFIYAFIDLYLNKKMIKNKRFVHICIAILSFFILYILVQNGLQSSTIKRIMGPYFAYALGAELSYWNMKSLNVKICIPLFFISFFILLICNDCGSVDLGNALFSSPWHFIISSLFGFLFLYLIACFLEKNLFLSKIFQYLGKNTLCIIGLHFLGFKVTIFAQILLKNSSIDKLSAFPFLDASCGWWVGYFFTSLLFCLFFNYLYKKSFNFIKNKIMY